MNVFPRVHFTILVLSSAATALREVVKVTKKRTLFCSVFEPRSFKYVTFWPAFSCTKMRYKLEDVMMIIIIVINYNIFT
jgi:hypothetical protein